MSNSRNPRTIIKTVEMRKELSPEEKEKLKDAFEMLDKKKKGVVSAHAITKILKSYGVQINLDEVKKMIKLGVLIMFMRPSKF